MLKFYHSFIVTILGDWIWGQWGLFLVLVVALDLVSNFCSSSTMGFIQSMNMSTLIIMYSMSIYLVTLEQLREASLFYGLGYCFQAMSESTDTQTRILVYII